MAHAQQGPLAPLMAHGMANASSLSALEAGRRRPRARRNLGLTLVRNVCILRLPDTTGSVTLARMGQVSDVIATLKARELTTTCSELVSALSGLGFEVRRRKAGNHHSLDHAGIPGFTGANFDGGHGKTVKACYVQAMRKLISKYELEINEFLKEPK